MNRQFPNLRRNYRTNWGLIYIAKAVVGKLGPEVLGDYERLKVAVLKEFKLSPNVYLDRFNTYRKADSESYVAFASRLKGLLNYYLESRHVDDFDGLLELLICDRIKSSLSEACYDMCDRPTSSSTCCSQYLRGRPGGRFQSAAGGVPVWASIDS